MKKIITLALMIFIIAQLFACSEPEQNKPEPPLDDGAIYGEGITTQIVTSEDEGIDTNRFVNKIKYLAGTKPAAVFDTAAKGEREIALGDTSRPISGAATAVLEERIDSYEQSDEYIFDTVFFCVYARGGSVALVWEGEEARDMALDYFFENYIKDERLKLDEGHTDFVAYSEIEEMRRTEAAEREETYKKIAEEYGEGVADALRDHISVYDTDFYIWLANLYDPGEYDDEGNPLGGGFYYSNSARDTAGYYIDLESTGQAISFLVSAGMVTNYKTDIPEKMQKEMVAFALSCQSEEDGYFYHPQWGKNIIPARRSRDLGWAIGSIIHRFGYQPYWDTPNGHEGIYGAPIVDRTSALTEPLGSSASVAVSRVLETASYVDKYQPYLRSLEAWQSYLDSLVSELETKSYSIGHNLAEQSKQIIMRDTEAKSHGEPAGYVEAVMKLFNDNQNPENGLWEKTVSYNSINGLMKIMALYNNLGEELNYAELAVASAVEIIKETGKDINGKEATGSVDVYNPWCAIDRVFTNVKTHGDASRVNAMRAELRENAEEMIRITTAKTVKFKKSDGSFGYTWNYSPALSQNAPVAVPNTVEGDVNGGTIALTAITGNMLNALGISGLTIYSPSDLKIFLNEIAKITHTEKEKPEDIKNVPFTFEDETVGEASAEGIYTVLTDGSVEIASDGRGGKALRLNTVPDKGDAFYVTPVASVLNTSCNILEFDIKFDEIRAGSSTAMQISLGNLYMLTVGITAEGVLTFADSSATNSSAVTSSFGVSCNAYEWHKVRVVHYRDAENLPIITELYVDGNLVGTSENYLGKESGTPMTGYGKGNFYALFSTSFSVCFDNVLADMTSDTYDKNK